jgi:amidase
MASTWQGISKCKKEEQWNRIPKEYRLPNGFNVPTKNVLDVPRTCGLMSQKELDITENFDATALAQELAAGRLKSVEVVQAFCKRAAIVHQVVKSIISAFEDLRLTFSRPIASRKSSFPLPLLAPPS